MWYALHIVEGIPLKDVILLTGEFDLADGGALVVGGRALVHAVVDLTHATDLQDGAAALRKRGTVIGV